MYVSGPPPASHASPKTNEGLRWNGSSAPAPAQRYMCSKISRVVPETSFSLQASRDKTKYVAKAGRRGIISIQAEGFGLMPVVHAQRDLVLYILRKPWLLLSSKYVFTLGPSAAHNC